MRITSHPLRGAAATTAVSRSTVFDRGAPMHFRFVDLTDADFIASLGQSPAPPHHWLPHYKRLEAEGREFYFVVVAHGQDRGLVRMNDFIEIGGESSFSWGDWVDHPPQLDGLRTITALAMYTLGFDVLGFARSHVAVEKANLELTDFHVQTGAELEHDDGLYLYFRFDPQTLHRFRQEKLVSEIA